MKFKVGDKVRVVEDCVYYGDEDGVFAKTNKGNAVGVIKAASSLSTFPYLVDIEGGMDDGYLCREKELALVEE